MSEETCRDIRKTRDLVKSLLNKICPNNSTDVYTHNNLITIRDFSTRVHMEIDYTHPKTRTLRVYLILCLLTEYERFKKISFHEDESHKSIVKRTIIEFIQIYE